MSETDPLLRAESVLRGVLGRAWLSLRPSPPPSYCTPPEPDLREDRWRRLDRVRNALEQTHTVIARDGWTRGAWFTVNKPSGGTRLTEPAEAFALADYRSEAVSACVVGTLLRLADNPDTAPSLQDVWGCVDELYEAIHEQLGHTSRPAGRSYSRAERHDGLRVLTAWNDAPGRTREHVLDLLDRAISRTIVGACRV